jgi:hypothetical protein
MYFFICFWFESSRRLLRPKEEASAQTKSSDAICLKRVAFPLFVFGVSSHLGVPEFQSPSPGHARTQEGGPWSTRDLLKTQHEK